MHQESTKNQPRHIAIIMDGNGRWAKKHGLPRIEGHRRGAQAVRQCLEAARDHGLRYLTLYAFSVENWDRPEEEVHALMDLLDQFLKEQIHHMLKHKIRLRVIGRYHELPSNIQKRLREAEERSAEFTKFTVGLALNYGSRTEVVDAARAIAKATQAGTVDPDRLDYAQFRDFLYTGDMPDPDLVIRTSGESRLSNFLLMQSAYSEIYFSEVLWPDFDRSSFEAALEDYAQRERRYGKTSEQLQTPAS
ncbi:MAG: Ditrans,polycis-undecaprenyl-diphosphate synthase ((2E,6E)-farnesyl-diphosphate specific) [Opitutia bacterium UBA7350]|nr:MAG: Ditrans,polycis-undecaprenyl-diphosphate synthase ((2E,6E)-farnesyl-diphosphate specific) [Opitutae bacterium UBA7350]